MDDGGRRTKRRLALGIATYVGALVIAAVVILIIVVL
jgi:hypothetical protein